MDEERLAEMRHEPSAILANNILEVAASIEQMASTAKNLKGTYVRRLRDDAGKARASITDLAKRTTAKGPLVALEQENIALRAQLEKAKKEIAGLKERGPQLRKEETGKGKRESPSTKRRAKPKEQLCPTRPKQVGPGMSTRTKDRSAPEEEEEGHQMSQQMQTLTEQVAALKEMVIQCIKRGMQDNQKNATREEPPPKSTGRDRKKVIKQTAKEERPDRAKTIVRRPDNNADRIPLPEPAGSDDTWSKVIGRKARKGLKEGRQETQCKAPLQERQSRKQKSVPKKNSKGGNPTIRPPRRAAVALRRWPQAAPEIAGKSSH